MRQEDITGKKFNRLKVVKFIKSTQKNKWMCICECGNKVITTGHKIKSGHTKSCGCLRDEGFKERVTKHGLSGTKIYHAWHDMIRRCYNSELNNFHNYGGRGITVCDEWKDNVESFYSWSILNGYRQGLTLDRVDNDGNYEPDNCRWATQKQQCKNRSTNVFIEHNGITRTLIDTARHFDITPQAIRYRLKKGWSIKEALETPKQLKIKSK